MTTFLLHVVAGQQRLLQAFHSLARRTLARQAAALSEFLRVFIGQLFQSFHLLLRLLETLGQPLAFAKRATPSAGPHSHPIVSDPVQRDHLLR